MIQVNPELEKGARKITVKLGVEIEGENKELIQMIGEV